MSDRRWYVDPEAEGGLTWGDPDDPDNDGWDVGEAFVYLEATPDVQVSRDALVSLVGIVRDLAATEDTAGSDDDDFPVHCTFCNAEPRCYPNGPDEDVDYIYVSPPLTDHAADCVWRRARELTGDET